MKAKKNIERKYEYDRKLNKERETKLTKDLARVNKENNEQKDEVIALNKVVKQLGVEKEKSK